MSSFKGAEICEIESVEKHPNADTLDIVKLKGKDYSCITQSSRKWEPGHYCVYVPEQSVVPDSILERIGLKGKLSGSQGNRVKAIKLRGILSQGLVLSLEELVGKEMFEDMSYHGAEPALGEDLSESVGIQKYEPPIPVSMKGEVVNLFGHTMKYDIENIKNYPDIFQEGESVYLTEKIHGTLVCFGWDPNLDNKEIYQNQIIIHSKGLGAKGLAFKWNKQNENLLYHRAFKKIEKEFFRMIDYFKNETHHSNVIMSGPRPFYLLGEVYGTGVQDLSYGEKEINVRFFDLYIGQPEKGHWVPSKMKYEILETFGLDMVPLIYSGSYNEKTIQHFTEEWLDGREFLSGNKTHVREGIVITPEVERYDNRLGRVILKSINPKYLTRKGGTEFN